MSSSKVLHRGLPVLYVGGFPSSYVMLLIGLVRRTSSMYVVCSFYTKTSIVILTCTSDLIPSLPPHMRVLQS